MKVVERGRDLVERIAGIEQPVEVEPTLLVEIDELRDVHLGDDRAAERAGHPLVP